MRNNTFILFLFTLFYLVNALQAQVENAFSSVQFEQFQRTNSLYTPCNLDTNYSTSISLGNRSYTGLFRGVNRIYLDVEHQLQKKNNSISHIGLLVKSENEGPLFRRNKIYGRYSQKLPLTSNLELCIGASIGMVNSAFGASQTSPGGSATALDMNVGLAIRYKNLQLGSAYQQITNSVLQPLNQTFTLNDYFNFHLNYGYNFNRQTGLRFDILDEWHQGNQHLLQAASEFYFLERIAVFVGVRDQRGISIGTGLKKIRINQHHLQFHASYLLAKSYSAIKDNVIEFSIQFNIK